jgi:hypothetical protein
MLITALIFVAGVCLGGALACGVIIFIINQDMADETYRKERQALEGRCKNDPKEA